MTDMMNRDPARVLTEAVEKLSMATSLARVTEVVAEAARELTGADGATFVLKDGEKCYYVDENAISPLWKGKRFPLEACISGWSMLRRELVVIPDIYRDSRIPVDAYQPTFVKSLCMVPIRVESPIGAIGNYWASVHVPSEAEMKLLQVLANSSAVALENLTLKEAIQKKSSEHEAYLDREKELEMAIHSLVHDLRGPIATMLAFSEVLEMSLQEHLDDESRKYLDSLRTTGMRMSKRIERMLSLYRVAHKALEKEKLSLTLLGREVVEELRASDPSRNVEFVIAPNLRAYGDPLLMRVALENLLANAFKYSSKKPLAQIELGKFEDADGQATFFVKDNGDGFDSAQASRLFRPLSRLHKDTEFPGTGLGLVSVARIVEMHGGNVRAQGSKSEGATFYFSLPLQE